MCIEREKVDFESREVNCLKECALALTISVSVSCSLRTNGSKNLNLYDFVMKYVIITFRQVIFSDASTSGFKSELIIRSILHAFVAIFIAFLKSSDAESLENM